MYKIQIQKYMMMNITAPKKNLYYLLCAFNVAAVIEDCSFVKT